MPKVVCVFQVKTLLITNRCLQQQRYEKSCSLLFAYRCLLDLCNSLPVASFTIMYHVSLPDLITCQFCSMNLHSSNLVSSTSERTSWGRKCLRLNDKLTMNVTRLKYENHLGDTVPINVIVSHHNRDSKWYDVPSWYTKQDKTVFDYVLVKMVTKLQT